MIYRAGCDPSGGGADEFAWSVAHAERDRRGSRVVVDFVKARGGRGRPVNPEAVVAEICADLAAYHIQEIHGDYYAAEWVGGAFRKFGIAYRRSLVPKSQLYLEFLPLLTAGRVELPPDREAVRQAKLLRRRVGTGGRDAVEHPAGGHDDRINAIVIAVLQAARAGGIDAPVTFTTRAEIAAEFERRQEGGLHSWERGSTREEHEAAKNTGIFVVSGDSERWDGSN